jgi:zinc/manganese transport system substrate-binding protein
MSSRSLTHTISRKVLATAAVAVLPLSMAACSSSGSSSSGSSSAASSAAASSAPAPAGKVKVVASTNVWGSVAEVVGGDNVDVTSIITKPTQDPHDYEATAQDKLIFTNAKIALVNGGGYDDWASTLAKGSDAEVVDAVKVSGFNTKAEPFNEHVFYSMDTARKVADVVATDLSKIDPTHASDYSANAKTFGSQIDKLKDQAKTAGAAHPGTTAVATEPVAGYLLTDMGIKNITPDAFVEQAETDAGPSVKVINDTSQLLTTHKAGLLVVNGQTSDDVTKKLQAAAASAKLPSVGVTETFPEGVTTYSQFVGDTITNISNALSK